METPETCEKPACGRRWFLNSFARDGEGSALACEIALKALLILLGFILAREFWGIRHFPLVVLGTAFFLITVRHLGTWKLQMWQIMLGAALALLLAGSVSPGEAARAVSPEIILFLSGMFILGEALVESGYLHHLSYRVFKSARSTDHLVLLVLFVMGILSAVLMNQTVAIIGAPLVLYLADRYDIPHKLMLLTLCFATTIGSVLSPIGNPQNLLVAVKGGLPTPFITYVKYLAIPTAINLFLAYAVLKVFYGNHFRRTLCESPRPEPEIKDDFLAFLCKLSLGLLTALVLIRMACVFLGINYSYRLTDIAVVAAQPIVIFSPRRWRILKNVRWETIIFFASLFIVVTTVWKSGVLQPVIELFASEIKSVDLMLIMSACLGLTKAPFVAVFIPIAKHLNADPRTFMALASGTTIAGNLLIFGAASNIIIIQHAEEKGKTLTFLEFALVGVPLTVLNILVYRIFLTAMT